MAWLPANFIHPTRVMVCDGYHLRPITAADTDLDYPAVMRSRQRLWSIYGQAWGWPPAAMTYQQDRDDLARHEAETAAHQSFNYALLKADAGLTPFEAVLDALERVGDVVAARVAPHAAQRQAIVDSSTELQERDRTKFAAVSDALDAALRERGAAPPTAGLLANVGVAIFRTAFGRWVDEPDAAAYSARVREAADELACALARRRSNPLASGSPPAKGRAVSRNARDEPAPQRPDPQARHLRWPE